MRFDLIFMRFDLIRMRFERRSFFLAQKLLPFTTKFIQLLSFVLGALIFSLHPKPGRKYFFFMNVSQP